MMSLATKQKACAGSLVDQTPMMHWLHSHPYPSLSCLTGGSVQGNMTAFLDVWTMDSVWCSPHGQANLSVIWYESPFQ